MKPTQPLFAPFLVLGLAIVTGGWLVQRGADHDRLGAALLDQVMSRVSSSYVDAVDRDSLYDAAVDGVLRRLGDPNSALLQADEFDNFSTRSGAEYGGVGLEIIDRDGAVVVVSPIPGTPGHRAGIRAGDRIVSVDGKPLAEATSERAVDLLRGEPGSEVTIGVARTGVDEPIDFDIERARIQVRSVPFGTKLEDDIAYVPLQVFGEASPDEFRATVDSLVEGGVSGLVLDLRGNPGGVLDAGIAVSELFLDVGADVVETRGRATGQSESYKARTPVRYRDLPMVVLIDERSASASEIVAGALQDHDRAVLVGTRSFGKGSVQTLYRLTGGNVLKLTTARWYTPSGRSIQALDEDQMARVDESVLTVDGQITFRPVGIEAPEFESFGGRKLTGGGGITPDIVVLPDTLSADESEAVRTLFRSAGRLSTVLFDYVVEYVGERPDLRPDFEMGSDALDGLYRAITDAGIEADRRVFDRAERFFRAQLDRQISEQAFGEEAAFLRGIPGDRQLVVALDLLRGAGDAPTLFERAAARSGEEGGRGTDAEDAEGAAPGEGADPPGP